MKVLFISPPTSGLGEGGFQAQIRFTESALKNAGVETVRYDPWVNQMDTVDLCHFFGPCGPMYPYAEAAKRRGKPVVISPVLGTGAVPGWQTALKVKLARRIPGFYTNYTLLGKILKTADRVLALTEEERSVIARLFSISKKQIEVIPNGIEPRFGEADAGLFRERYRTSDFVLQVGTFHPIKNQLTTIRAIRDLPHRLVLIGDALVGQDAYMEECRRQAGTNVIFVGRLAHEDPLLASAYAACRVFVLPSLSEVMPLSLYEAALARCRLIVSKNVYVAEEIRDFIDRFHPAKPGELRNLIEKNMKLTPSEELKSKVLEMPTWDKVGKRIAEIYRELLR